MWTAISGVLLAICFALSLWAALSAARAVAAVMGLRDDLRRFAASNSKPDEQRMTELEETVRLMANKLKMMKVRNALTHVKRDADEEPDVRSDPEAWRAWMNAKLRASPPTKQ